MGTGGLVVFRSVRDGQKSVFACIYFQCDGYYTSLGVRLAEFLQTCELVNGLSGKPSNGKTICNGFGCLVAQFIAEFKTGAGHLYLFPTDCKLEMEFVYVVEYDGNQPGEPLSIKTWTHAHAQPETLKSMSPAEFHAFSLRGGDEETDAESAAGPKIPKAACEALSDGLLRARALRRRLQHRQEVVQSEKPTSATLAVHRVLFVSLARQTKRRQAFLQQLHRFPELLSRVEWIRAVDGSTLQLDKVPRRSVTPQGIQDAGTPHPKVLGYILTRGAIGLALSMHEALERIALDKEDDHVYLLCEDDAMFAPSFTEEWRRLLHATRLQDPQWEVLHLGFHAACTTIRSCGGAPEVGDPVQELNTFKQFYKDTMLVQARKHGKTGGIQGAFEELGGGNDGQVTREEMVKYLTKNNYPGDANALFDLVDVDNEGLITKAEFGQMTELDFIKKGPVRAFKNFLCKKFGKIEEAFKKLDTTHDKEIDSKEFVASVENLGYEGDADIMFQLLDEDKDGKVTLGELKKLLGKLKKVEEENPNEGEQELSTPTNDKKGKKAKKHKPDSGSWSLAVAEAMAHFADCPVGRPAELFGCYGLALRPAGARALCRHLFPVSLQVDTELSRLYQHFAKEVGSVEVRALSRRPADFTPLRVYAPRCPKNEEEACRVSWPGPLIVAPASTAENTDIQVLSIHNHAKQYEM
ncbi:hypothetical protein AK812_SmicGene38879 [Symbiodinium microadriaticum]|uniref:EF-hand domain-containing protein n=1 Tax=Symbiodinium microadriaticum TaxID=2951 RepID=A0A1Q9CCM3_SYMMI|nr:hypothetical protein AK812_SmicGene38879 [Symbiodinium microadriaticum]CAE7938322.1 unnamed protein product [Symbiodinium sp. KB8]